MTNTRFDVQNLPPEYKPLGAWAYFGWTLLFNVPVVGLIFLVVLSLGGTHRINLRNYARSFFCVYALALIVCLILFATGVGAGLLSSLAGMTY